MKVQTHDSVPRYAWLAPASSDPTVPAMRITTSAGTLDLTSSEFEALAELLHSDFVSRRDELTTVHLREDRRRPRRRFRLAFAALVFAVVPSLTACGGGGGPSMDAAPSIGPSGAFCVPEGFRTRYLNAPAPELGLEETVIAARNLVSSALTRGPDGGCWVSLRDDPCVTDSLLDRANTAPRSDRPQVVREIEADLRFSRDREHRRCYASGEYEGGPWVMPPGATNGPPATQDRGSADAGGTDDLEDDPGVRPSRAEGPR